MLDRYRGWRVVDERRKLVEADAGIHLGADPNDPTGTATLERSLLWQLATQKAWTLSNTGGITHQTISGFVATGSSGGSVQFSANENLHGFRVIDGRGDVHDLRRDDDEAFYALAPSVGLLGVISKITFACTDLFAIEGEESVQPARECAIDLFGDGAAGRPSLEAFLRDTEYARMLIGSSTRSWATSTTSLARRPSSRTTSTSSNACWRRSPRRATSASPGGSSRSSSRRRSRPASIRRSRCCSRSRP